MTKYNSRGARLTALALATGTLVVSATAPAGADAVPVPDIFGGRAQGTAIHLEVNLPAPVNLPGIGDITSLVQDISFTEGNTAKDLVAKPTSVAKAVLGNGNVVVLSDVLGKAVISSLDGKSSANDSILAQDLGLLKIGVGEITSAVSPDSATSALTSTSSSSLASLRIGLAGLPDLPLKTDLNAVVNQLNDTVDGAQSTVGAAVENALGVLDEATQGAAAPVVAQVEAVKAQLTSLLDSLQNTIANLSADTDLVRLSLLESTETITRAGAMVTAKATSGVGGLDILGGLVHLDAVKTESFSSANGSKGAAAADTLTTILGLKVADVLDLKLTSEGLSGTVLGNALPAEAQDAIQTVISQVNGVLALAGVTIVNGQTTKAVDANGKFASSSSEGVGIVVNPLKAAKPLVKVQLVPAGTAVNAAIAPRAVTPPKVTTPETKTPLARTGVELPLFAVIGTGLVGVALVARRRRTVEA
ncbi:MAG TPA: choice-of-anchor P family protein [Frankiaceae bacterium]|jgi:hypothetical protein|nr:choice-of-anchor P family protein [Frankiaceae bacterium]